MNIHLQEVGDGMEISIQGEMQADFANYFREKITPFLIMGKPILLNLSEVTKIDLGELKSIILIQIAAYSVGSQLKLVGVNSATCELLNFKEQLCDVMSVSDISV